MEDIYIARQAVYDRNLELIGYELLYRDSADNVAEFDSAEKASSDTIVNSFIHIGIDNLVGTSLAFVNLPEQFLLNLDLIPMFYEQTILEVLETVNPTLEVIDGLLRLKKHGYRIALDDFTYSEKMQPLLEIADIVKIDVLDYNETELVEIVNKLKPYKVKLIAEKVETQAMFDQCKALDFDFYQGFFFCYPQVVVERVVPANKLVVLKLLSKLQDPALEFSEIENILSQDITLSYKLLRYINSAAFSLRREIESIKDAVVLLGKDTVKNWISLLLMSRVADDKPEELIIIALVRARMAEEIAKVHFPDVKNQAFICGLFSVLDALMDRPMIDLLDTVILSMPIKMALLDKEGDLGIILSDIHYYEAAKFERLSLYREKTSIYYDAYITAVKWADETLLELSENV